MEHKKIVLPSLSFFQNELKGEGVVKSRRTLGELAGIFENQDAYSQLPLDQLAYEVYSYLPEREGTPGGLYFGITQLYPGKVGDEYFMTKGHFHQQEDRSEYYWGLEGEGMLILMDRERNTWAERMMPGSLHYIPGGVAHRVANTGNSVLSFAACWPSDAGHNYEEIANKGFSARLVEVNGTPKLR
ncbi:MAG: glucose-6-phosphate isomerase [Parabacteroides sp.]|nr:glucose-6-phosphate isomerase [Parabacteroides sp.]